MNATRPEGLSSMTLTVARFRNFAERHRRWLTGAIFFVGLAFRFVIFVAPHREGDELIYMTLVEQLERGRGYTLQGSAILEQGIIDPVGYDRPLFFHPPAGVALFLISSIMFGSSGFPLVQLCSYAFFFWGMLLLYDTLKPTGTMVGRLLTALLSAFCPIMAHVTTRFWLDGPLLAVATCSMVLFLRGVKRDDLRYAVAAGLLLGFGGLIKITAFLVIPAALWLARVLPGAASRAGFVRFALALLIPAGAVHLPWELVLWQTYGSPLPGWAGKPSQNLIENNAYVYYLTKIRTPWSYVSLAPRVLWTLVPALLLTLCHGLSGAASSIRRPLLLWAGTVLIFHMVVGWFGYSIVLRYLILLVPPAILLFSQGMDELMEHFNAGGADRSRVYLLFIAILAITLEIIQGIVTTFSYTKDLIVPLIGGME